MATAEDKEGEMRALTKFGGRSCGCCLVIVLAAILLAAGLLFLAVRAARAEEGAPANEVVLVSDQSPSMWDCDGIGTDPDMLRVDAARLFINYLGADSSARHRLALLHFGGAVEQIAPLTDLGDEAARRQLTEAAGQARPIRWTDPLAALRQAGKMLQVTGQPGSRRLIVLMTDGLPTPPGASDTAAGMDGYYDEMRAEMDSLTRAGVTLAVVLLSDRSTSCGREVADAWQDRWATLAARTPHGDLYTAETAADLLPMYHAIVREWTGAAAGSAASHSTLLKPEEPWIVALPVETDLSGMILTIWKHDPSTLVEVTDPWGKVMRHDAAGVTVAGRPGQSREEVWRIERPQLGLWHVTLTGRGRVSVWYDIRPLPTPQPTHTSTAAPSATATLAPSPTAATASGAAPTTPPEPTATARPEAAATDLNGASTPMEPAGFHYGRWLALMGGSLLLISGGALRVAGHRRRNYLTGRLVALSGLTGEALPTPRELDAEHARTVVLGVGDAGEWQLAGWQGTVRLESAARGEATLIPVLGEVRLNDQPLVHATLLADGDVIACGAYRIRYENLLNGGDQ
jgi:Mg-chelatase subunit ChlD